MPKGGGRGGKRSHKGRNRHFTSVEELEQQSKKAEKEREWRRQQGIPSDSEDSDEEGATAKKTSGPQEESGSESDSDGDEKVKGVGHLIEVSNPNRAAAATRTKKVSNLTEAEAPQLSRREREEIQKQQAAMHYRKLHEEGKTEEARADLARLAIIRKEREEKARKKAEEQKQKQEKTSAAEQKVLDRRKASKK